MKSNQAHILIVDDDRLNLEIISKYLNNTYKITTVEDADIAWKILEQSPTAFDAILLDRMMQKMHDLKVLEKIKQHPILQYCPVIFQTAKTSVSNSSEGINAGAYYYLSKPFDEEVLLSVVKTAVSDHTRTIEIQRNLEQNSLNIGMLTSANFEFKTLQEVRSIASFISNSCPEPSSVIMGLTELMINAIEHGNLGITYKEKTTLNTAGTWVNEVCTRQQLAENMNKTARIDFHHHSDYIEITVVDEGKGFDWESYMDFAPSRAMDNHGRGIAIANKLSFSSVEYQGNGNTVCARLLLT